MLISNRRFSRCMFIATALSAITLSTAVQALDAVKFMAPGSVGGGYDQT
jgi:putative tricarboxylic transport membrane protein